MFHITVIQHFNLTLFFLFEINDMNISVSKNFKNDMAKVCQISKMIRTESLSKQ